AGGFAAFATWAEAVRFWHGKIVDPAYAYARTVTIEDYIRVYAPASDGNDEAAYYAAIRALIATLPASSDPPPVRGRVPKPPVVRSWVTNKRIGHGREPDQQRAGRIVGTCHHTMEGFLLGTDHVFHDPAWPGLTDYGIGGAPDGPRLDGVIYEWIDPDSRVVPWANGTVGGAIAPYGDAPAFLSTFGRSAVNARLRSIETSDGANPNADKSQREIESLCLLTAWIHSEQAGQTAETFAWNLHHREFGVDHQQCPGAYIITHVDAIQTRTKAIMRAYQTNTALTPPLMIIYPPGWTGGGYPGGVIPQPGAAVPTIPTFAKRKPLPGPLADRLRTGHQFVVCERTLRCRVAGTPVLQFADPTAPPVRPPLAKGARITTSYITVGEDGELWFVTKNGSRIPASAFIEQLA
ncbi:MAG: hypothetical protein QOF01_4109, partial [Thermomicrobiales bacterium]|nr:hypothetical protein [Thermomicrobiales bacterium]